MEAPEGRGLEFFSQQELLHPPHRQRHRILCTYTRPVTFFSRPLFLSAVQGSTSQPDIVSMLFGAPPSPRPPSRPTRQPRTGRTT